MRLDRDCARFAALAGALIAGLLAAPQAQAFTIENKDAGGDGASYSTKNIQSDRYGSGKSTTMKREGFFFEMKQFGSSTTNSPSGERNVNDVAPRDYNPSPSLFR